MDLMTHVALASLWGGFLLGLVIFVFLFSCLLLIGIILLQKGRGGGLSSAFGGAGGASPFGTKTGDVFTWITVVLAGIFLLCALALNMRGMVKPKGAETGINASVTQQPVAPQAKGANPPAEKPELPATPSAESATQPK